MNKQVVALPYQKFGLQVYESGINYVVDIPRLEAQITYNGLSFSIRLPYHLFGNNTKGQCGESPQPLSLEGKTGCEHLLLSCGAVGSLLLCGQAPWHSLVFGPCEKPSDVSLTLTFPSCLASGAQGESLSWRRKGARARPGSDSVSWCWLDGWLLCAQAPAPTILRMTASYPAGRSSPIVRLLLTSGW